MVFKVVSGVDKRIWQTYNSGDTSAELVTAALDVTNQHQDHYKNRVVLNWENFNPSQVREISHGTFDTTHPLRARYLLGTRVPRHTSVPFIKRRTLRDEAW